LKLIFLPASRVTSYFGREYNDTEAWPDICVVDIVAEKKKKGFGEYLVIYRMCDSVG
ncbi:repulsive guidance molecule A-like X2, partial [Biomphalaria glabrata]